MRERLKRSPRAQTSRRLPRTEHRQVMRSLRTEYRDRTDCRFCGYGKESVEKRQQFRCQFCVASDRTKTLLSRMNPLFPTDCCRIHMLSFAAEDEAYTSEKAVSVLQGWVDCFEYWGSSIPMTDAMRSTIPTRGRSATGTFTGCSARSCRTT